MNQEPKRKKPLKNWLIVSTILAVIGMTLIFVSAMPSLNSHTPIDQTPINFGYTQLNNTMYKLSGKPVVIFIGSDQCSYCRAEKPLVLQAYQKYKDSIILDLQFDTFQPSLATQQCLDKSNFQGSVPYINFGCKYERTGLTQNFNTTIESQQLEYMFESLLK